MATSFTFGHGKLTINGCDIGSVTGASIVVEKQLKPWPALGSVPEQYVAQAPTVTMDVQMSRTAILRGDVAPCQICGHEDLALVWADGQVTCIRCCYAAKVLAEQRTTFGLDSPLKALVEQPSHSSIAGGMVVGGSIEGWLRAVGERALGRGFREMLASHARKVDDGWRPLSERMRDAAAQAEPSQCLIPSVHAPGCECRAL